MRRILMYIGLILILAIVGFFVVESMAFKNYLRHGRGAGMPLPINAGAPVKATAETEIAASIDTVWQILTTIDAWPGWQKEISASKLAGELREGAGFTWKAGGLSFSSAIHTMRPKTFFGWTGKTIGAYAVHNWIFEERNGHTFVRVEESLQGVFPRLFKSYFQSNLENGVKRNVMELKEAAEHAGKM